MCSIRQCRERYFRQKFSSESAFSEVSIVAMGHRLPRSRHRDPRTSSGFLAPDSERFRRFLSTAFSSESGNLAVCLWTMSTARSLPWSSVVDLEMIRDSLKSRKVSEFTTNFRILSVHADFRRSCGTFPGASESPRADRHSVTLGALFGFPAPVKTLQG